MQKALYGTHGPKLSLREYVFQEGGQRNWSLWKEKPLCSHCGQPVHPYDIDGALGFKLAGRNVTHPHILTRPGFHHLDGTASEDCPSNFKNDPRYAALSAHRFDVRRQEKIIEVLFDKHVREVNGMVMRRLWGALAGRAIKDDDRKRLGLVAKKKLYNMEVLVTHPWIMPYVLLGLEQPHEKRFKSGKTGQVVFRGEGKQLLVYHDFEGDLREAYVPQALQLCFANITKKGKLRLTAMKLGEVRFPVSKEEAYRLAHFSPPKAGAIGEKPKIPAIQLTLGGCQPPSLLQGPP